MNKCDLKEIILLGREIFDTPYENKSFLRKDWQGTAVGARMTGEASVKASPLEMIASGPDGAQKVRDYLEYLRSRREEPKKEDV
jgi:hypothetical protein